MATEKVKVLILSSHFTQNKFYQNSTYILVIAYLIQELIYII